MIVAYLGLGFVVVSYDKEKEDFIICCYGCYRFLLAEAEWRVKQEFHGMRVELPLAALP